MSRVPSRLYGELAFQTQRQVAVLDSTLRADDYKAFEIKSSYEEDRLDHWWQSAREMEAVAAMTEFATLIDMTAVIKVIVGKSPERSWTVHEHLFTSASRFAKAALTQPFKEQEEKTIRLPEEDPVAFGIFVKYLYTSAIDFPSQDVNLRLYKLGDRLQATELCEKVHSKITGLFGDFNEAQLGYIFDNTTPGDPLRRSCLLQLATSARSSSPFPFSDEFTRSLCEKHASEILAYMVGKYDSIVLQTGGTDGTSAEILPNQEPSADPKPSAAAHGAGKFRTSSSAFVRGFGAQPPP